MLPDLDQRHLIVVLMSLKSFFVNTVIINQGDQPDYFYIFETVFCSVMKTINDVETFICKIEAGGYAEELGVISEIPKDATIIDDTDVTAWEMDKKTYW
jgi:CRP-like cAMP-binding protein